jgi:hypothetical protein
MPADRPHACSGWFAQTKGSMDCGPAASSFSSAEEYSRCAGRETSPAIRRRPLSAKSERAMLPKTATAGSESQHSGADCLVVPRATDNVLQAERIPGRPRGSIRPARRSTRWNGSHDCQAGLTLKSFKDGDGCTFLLRDTGCQRRRLCLNMCRAREAFASNASPHYERVLRLATAKLKRKLHENTACAFTGYSMDPMNTGDHAALPVEKYVHHGRKMRPVAIGMVRPPTYTFSIRVPLRVARTCIWLGRSISMPCSITVACPLATAPCSTR